jgi:hypothetical protein
VSQNTIYLAATEDRVAQAALISADFDAYREQIRKLMRLHVAWMSLPPMVMLVLGLVLPKLIDSIAGALLATAAMFGSDMLHLATWLLAIFAAVVNVTGAASFAAWSLYAATRLSPRLHAALARPAPLRVRLVQQGRIVAASTELEEELDLALSELDAPFPGVDMSQFEWRKFFSRHLDLVTDLEPLLEIATQFRNRVVERPEDVLEESGVSGIIQARIIQAIGHDLELHRTHRLAIIRQYLPEA